jgi:hypothetical protein
MFEPMHMVVGATIDKAAGGGKWKKILLVAPLAFATHPLLDYFNCGPHTLFHGPMTGPINAAVIGVGFVLMILLIVTARRHWVGMLFAVLPDLEWVIFGITGWDQYQGLHHKLFWPHWLATEWGILVQLGLFMLIACVVLLPLRKPFRIPAWVTARNKDRARERLPERAADLAEGTVPVSASVWRRISVLPARQGAQAAVTEQRVGRRTAFERGSLTLPLGARSGNKRMTPSSSKDENR